ncbi:RagB/SusD domain protein [Pseudopedobacter saltans DSM 12145]|uniref:RagB/SusD domain protein n=1 Tax=Pseudopedobacter saltans (strain ATCC 51119 / DSM 12145 / JCM 21818 / CCUG 39354 / LMG 10337 / NBRC 100064 / NCIMB 13643) TaxID=762903 RepID=F0SCL6_PSESL|nr:RagB/SusD family nutrient uptake outer membrane protein [Pseudopedobacter saltans]ADY53860.1 RagB/SusD domain protein [Pseudopedobacter saltans DSM 12145]
MKKSILNILLLGGLAVAIFTAGCTKDFLQKPKGGAVTVDTIFHTKNQAQFAVSRMYTWCVRGYLPQGSTDLPRPEILTDALYIISPGYDWANLGINAPTYKKGNMGANSNVDYGWGAGTDKNVTGGAFGWHYKGIRQANLVLKNIDMVVDADQAWKSDVKGQAIFCRALQHYELFRYYGGIPIVSNALAGDGNINLPRRSIQSVVDSVVKWCDQAANLLPPTRSSSDYGKITKLAAMALKSRILLYAASPLYNTPDNMKSVISPARYGDQRDTVLCYPNYDKERWKRAADAAKDVIDNAAAAGVEIYNTGKAETDIGTDNYAGLGDYEAVWNVFANKELILVSTKNQDGGDWGATLTAWGKNLSSKVGNWEWGVKNNMPIEFMQLYEKRDGTKFTLPASGTDLPVDIRSFNLDPRFYQTVAYDGMFFRAASGGKFGVVPFYKAGDGFQAGALSASDVGPDGYALDVYKFVARVDNGSWNHFAWPVFRLAEFYLSYAEAINEYNGGPNSEAYKYLNDIRKRAGMPDKAGLDYQAFQSAVQNERTIELAYEGHRYNDLLRWLKAHTVLNTNLRGIATTAKKGGDGSLKRSWEIVPFMTQVFPLKYYYLPFITSEVSKKYLGDGASWDGQNPGW